jgi:hypothetical protein
MVLTDDSIPLVRRALDELLKHYTAADDELVGVTCIAKGSDALFAEAVLAVGGRLVAVIPSKDYRRNDVEADHAPLFDRLVKAADEVLVLPYETADRQAYAVANAVLLERADRLVAVWNRFRAALKLSAAALSALVPTAPRERITRSLRHAFAKSFEAYWAPLSLWKTAQARSPPRVRAAASRASVTSSVHM